MDINLERLPSGQTYEDRYQGYMKIFHDIAHTPRQEAITVYHPPYCWVPLLFHLNCEVVEPVENFKHCRLIAKLCHQMMDRTAIEVLCGFRPECVDALWKVDMQWEVDRVRTYTVSNQEFIVTNNGSFHRPEVLDYLQNHLRGYEPQKRNVLIVPCAADKPYPSPLHKVCLNLLPDDYYMMNATGVVGLVPQELWSVMPYYDSGIPNQWRLFEVARNYFSLFAHDRIVVYCDFYAHVLHAAFKAAKVSAKFVLPPIRYDDYVNLMDPDRLYRLREALYPKERSWIGSKYYPTTMFPLSVREKTSRMDSLPSSVRSALMTPPSISSSD